MSLILLPSHSRSPSLSFSFSLSRLILDSLICVPVLSFSPLPYLVQSTFLSPSLSILVSSLSRYLFLSL